jgi:hypothetical protein
MMGSFEGSSRSRKRGCAACASAAMKTGECAGAAFYTLQRGALVHTVRRLRDASSRAMRNVEVH